MPNLPTEHDSSTSICPFLGTAADGGNEGLPIEYPSFENRCLVSERREGLMLTDQATFCLSRGHRYCPRFVANRATLPQKPGSIPLQSSSGATFVGYDATQQFADYGEQQNDTGFATGVNPTLFTDSLQDIEAEIQGGFRDHAARGRRWGWFGAALIFLICLMCGGASAAYIGWQLVNTNLIAVQPGDLDMIASNSTPALPQIYFVVTATSDPQSTAQHLPVPQSTFQTFPQAVTPTPLMLGAAIQPSVNVQSQSEQASVNIPQVTQSQANVIAADVTPVATTAIINNIDLQIPTRRPTPEFDVPTSTAMPLADMPTATSTPVPFLGPPVVIFSADDSSLLEGKCTTVTWHVENVRAVYYENLGVDGHGEREECVDDRDGEYTLTVVLQDGATRTYTTTVDMVRPTDTPAPTMTFTPKPASTATWTPIVPTDTPTPDHQYGVQLAIDGSDTVTCSPGEACEIGLLVTNTSKVVDTLTVVFSERGAWPSRFCRMDGVCSEDELSVVSVGPSNTAFIQLIVQVPDETDHNSTNYSAMALSDGSGRTKSSSPVTITAVRSTEGE